MANSYTNVLGTEYLPCSAADYAALKRLLDEHESHDLYPGIALDYIDGTGVLINTPESATVDDISPEFWQAFGKLIAAAGKKYTTFGVAHTSDREASSSVGGDEFRVYADGAISWVERSYGRKPSVRKQMTEFVARMLDQNDSWQHPVHTLSAWRGSGCPYGYRTWLVQRLMDAKP